MKKSLKPLLWVLILVISISLIAVFSSGGCRCALPSLTHEEEEVKEIATSYLNAWEYMNYDAMCSYLETGGRSVWIDAMENFPVPVRDWKIERVRTESSEIVIEYSVEAPNLGYILRAFVDDNPKDKARLLLLDGTFTTWEDTLRLTKEDGGYKILSNIETEKASNRLVSYINSLGISVSTVHPVEDAKDRFLLALAMYGVEFDISTEELEKMIPEIIDQFGEWVE